jgi:glycerol-1-phosphate dehydrogenase [NAD(P)+]
MPAVVRLDPEPFHLDIRTGAIANLQETLTSVGSGPVAIAVGPGLGEHIRGQLLVSLGDTVTFLAPDVGTLVGAEALARSLTQGGYQTVVGIGGGQTLDTAKLAGARAGVKMVAVATNLAHDGLASPVAVLEHEGRRESFAAVAPAAIVVDLDFVRAAPDHMVRVGVGDVISNLTAVADWELARDVQGEDFNGLAALLARTAAESIVHRTDTTSDDFLVALAEALVVSGFAMLVAGSSRPCSGSDHEISHAIDHLFPRTAAHGEQVGVATLFSLVLRDDLVRADQVERCLRCHALPIFPHDLGLSESEFASAVLKAPSTRPDRFTILEHVNLDDEGVAAVVDTMRQRYLR